ncbi:hypothetical protein MJO28_017067, partial [Puccinia striiformis f. sp. tritici]
TPNPARSWVKTKNDTYWLFDITMAVHITRFNQFSLVYRVKDTINTRFITESWTNPLLKEKMEALDEHYPVRLYNPIIKLEGIAHWDTTEMLSTVARPVTSPRLRSPRSERRLWRWSQRISHDSIMHNLGEERSCRLGRSACPCMIPFAQEFSLWSSKGDNFWLAGLTLFGG